MGGNRNGVHSQQQLAKMKGAKGDKSFESKAREKGEKGRETPVRKGRKMDQGEIEWRGGLQKKGAWKGSEWITKEYYKCERNGWSEKIHNPKKERSRSKNRYLRENQPAASSRDVPWGSYQASGHERVKGKAFGAGEAGQFAAIGRGKSKVMHDRLGQNKGGGQGGLITSFSQPFVPLTIVVPSQMTGVPSTIRDCSVRRQDGSGEIEA